MVRLETNDHQHPRSIHMYVVKLLVIVVLLPNEIDGVNNAPVITVNPVSPGSSDGTARISKNAEIGTLLAVVFVTDTDAGQDGETTCKIISDSFSLDQLSEGTYKVQLLSKLDRDFSATKEVNIVCYDKGSPPVTARVPIIVEVVEVNDHVAPYFIRSVYNFTVAENTVGSTTFSVLAINQNAQIVYSIPDVNQKRVSINPQSGTISIETALDYEIDHEVSFTVRATDGGIPSLSSEAEVVLTIEDVNDNRPEFTQATFTFDIPENTPIGGTAGAVSARDLDSGEYAELSYSLTDCNVFSINSFGTITVAQQLNKAMENRYECVVTVFDNPNNPSDSLQSTANVTFVVTDGPINGQPTTSVLSKSLCLVLSCLWIKLYHP